VNYRVEFLRVVEQRGVLEIEAGSKDEALQAATELAALPGKVVKHPTWEKPKTETKAIGVTEVAA
jgi:hypothetical protein